MIPQFSFAMIGVDQFDAVVGMAVTLAAVGMLAMLVLQAVLVATRGQTIGKMAVGAQIVWADFHALPGFWKGYGLLLVVSAILVQHPHRRVRVSAYRLPVHLPSGLALCALHAG